MRMDSKFRPQREHGVDAADVGQDDSIDLPGDSLATSERLEGKEPRIDFRRQELDAEFGRRRPLRDWLVMSGLCLSLAVVITGRSLIQAVWKDHSGVAPCIAVVFLIAFGKSLHDVLYIDREFKRTDEQIRLLWKTNNIRSFLDKASPGIFRHHVANLVSIFKRDDRIAQDNLIELVHTRLKARIRPLDVASNIMVSLGLVGTIVGLIGSVGGLGTAMANAGTNQAGLLSGMNETLGGMGVAFAATLLGAIFGGVILRLIYTTVNGQAEHLVAHIAEITEVYILPVLRHGATERRRATDRADRVAEHSMKDRTARRAGDGTIGQPSGGSDAPTRQ